MPIPDPLDLSRGPSRPRTTAVGGQHLRKRAAAIEVVGADQSFGGWTQIIGQGSDGIRHALTLGRPVNAVRTAKLRASHPTQAERPDQMRSGRSGSLGSQKTESVSDVYDDPPLRLHALRVALHARAVD